MEMDVENKLNNFELALRSYRDKKSPLYKEKNVKEPSDELKPVDVIKDISKQIKAINENEMIIKNKNYKLNAYKKCSFIPVNMLSVEPQQKPSMSNNFETQYAFDTQLLSIIEDAEALIDSGTGVTQEFEIPFDKMIGEQTHGKIENADLNEQKNLIMHLHKLSNSSENSQTDNNNLSENDKCHNILFNKLQNDNPINEVKTCNSPELNVIYTRAGSVSPILNQKSIINVQKNPITSYKLESFEKFEAIAGPIVQEYSNIQAAKRMITIEMLKNDTFITDNVEKFYKNNEELSSVLKIKSETDVNKQVGHCSVIVPDKFEDGILFSSDEESDFMQNRIEELPLTCALTTSFYDQADVLNKTMYVGFQTASNKSIQILTNSFSKAKSILDDVNKKTSNTLSLSELVEVYDSALKEKPNISQNVYIKQKDNFCQSHVCKQENSNKIDTKGIISNIQVGFKPASGTSINISEKAWNKCNTIFNNIDYGSDKEIADIKNFNKTQECVVKSVRELPEKDLVQSSKQALCSSYTQEQINIDENIIQEFEDNSLCINDNKLHTNFDIANDATKMYTNNITYNQVIKASNPTNTVCGFTTASNKIIKVSEAGMNRIKNVFKDIDFDLDSGHIQNEMDQNHKADLDKKEANTPCMDSTIQFTGFKTANNKNIKFSKEALAKSNKILQGIDFESDLINDISKQKCDDYFPKDIIPNKIKTDKKVFKGFKSASNKPINISEDALLKSNDMLKEIDCESMIITEMLRNDQDRDKKKSREFETVPNKSTNISIDDVKNSYKILQEINFQPKLVNNKDINKCFFQGFKMVSNKPINISEDALVKSNNIFKEFNCESIITKGMISNDHNITNDKISCREFETASHNPTNIFKQDVTAMDSIIKVHKDFIHGFKTASNKPITISEDALEKSNKLLQDIDFKSDLTKYKKLLKNTGAICNDENTDKRFNTSSNKAFDEALAKCIVEKSANLHDIKCIENKPHNTKTKTSPFVEGFKTASNKRVKVSNQALAQTKNIFQDIFCNENYNLTSEASNKRDKSTDVTAPKCSFQGFKTANNNEVKISKGALAKSKKLFQDINQDNEQSDKQMVKNTDYKINMGFQTANNKEVNISEEALLKSKRKFDNISVDLKNSIKDNLKNVSVPRQNNSFKMPNNNNIEMCKNALGTGDLFNNNLNKKANYNDLKNVDNIINTEMIVDFEDTLYTEDFINKSPVSKRSGSPILSCPKPKKTKITNHEIKFVDKYNLKNGSYEFRENYKRTKKYNLLDIYQIEKQSDKLELELEKVFNIDNILNFEFGGIRNELSNVKWTTDNIKQYFVESVDKKIIPEGWVDNHLKMIVLKLISYEKRFPNSMAYVCSVINVLEQLKYRYDRELYNVERPALRKILEKDEVSYRRIVLKVLNIYSGGVSITNFTNLGENIELLVSDGWYFVKATIDKMLVKLVYDGEIAVGTKLITQGAELLNCEQGVAPWENTSSVRLKIFGNSTRRAHWAARLGFHGNGAILSYLSTIKPGGGKISQLRVAVTRVYPMLYVEKFDDGSTVTRSERLENLHQMKYETEREMLLEKVYEEIEKESSNHDSQDDGSLDDKKSLESGSQIWQLMKKNRDPVEFRANLTRSQAKILEEYTMKRREAFVNDLQCKVQELLKKRGLNIARNVVPMLKIRVADVYKMDVTKAMITIWRPNESLLDIFQEGACVDLFNVVPTGVRYSEIQISAGKQSVFRKTSKTPSQMSNLAKTFQRKCYLIHELTQNPLMATDYNEIDTVGLVFDIAPSIQEFDGKKQLFQNVFLADMNKKIICVNFWGGLKKFGFDNILETGQVVACVNLQKRSGNTRKNIPQYRATEFSYFTKTPKINDMRKICDDLSKQFLSLDRRKFIQDCIDLRKNFVNIIYGNIENISPYRFNNSDYNLSKNKAFINSPIGDNNLNLSGLDFESTFKQTEVEFSPKRLQRKKEINEKIAKLKKYGEPPPLSSIHIVNKSKDAEKPYKSPLITKNEANNELIYDIRRPLILNTKVTPTTNTIISNLRPNTTNPHNVANDKTKSSNITRCTSPVLPYRCRTVHPVKLNFSKPNDISKDDPFGEDFESPPLSLE